MCGQHADVELSARRLRRCDAGREHDARHAVELTGRRGHGLCPPSTTSCMPRQASFGPQNRRREAALVGVSRRRVVDGYAPTGAPRTPARVRLAAASPPACSVWNTKVWLDPERPSMSSDRFRDIAFDAQYQYVDGAHAFSARRCTCVNGKASDGRLRAAHMASNESNSSRLPASEPTTPTAACWAAAFVFSTRGSADSVRYGWVRHAAAPTAGRTPPVWLPSWITFRRERGWPLRRTAYRSSTAAPRLRRLLAANASGQQQLVPDGVFSC